LDDEPDPPPPWEKNTSSLNGVNIIVNGDYPIGRITEFRVRDAEDIQAGQAVGLDEDGNVTVNGTPAIGVVVRPTFESSVQIARDATLYVPEANFTIGNIVFYSERTGLTDTPATRDRGVVQAVGVAVDPDQVRLTL